MERKIPLAGPWITEKEKEYVLDAVSTAWYSGAYKYIKLFEQRFAEHLGRKYAVSLSTCTAGLHLCLVGLGIGPGDEVIVPDATWIATAAPVNYVGATPVFADIDKETWCMSPDSLKKCITDKTKAIITVDLYGNIPRMNEIIKIAKEKNIPVIEDAAEAIGSEYFSKKAGALSEMAVFSFHGSKTLTTGEGGMLVTDDEEIYKKAIILRDHGRYPGEKKLFWSRVIGFKYRMSDLQAALGLAQLERLDELVKRKIEIFEKYKTRLSEIKGIEINPDIEGVKNSYWMITVIFDESLKLEKEEAIELLSKKNIDARPFFYPLSSVPPYAVTEEGKWAQKENKMSYSISKRGINLPSALGITDEDIDRVCNALKDVVGSRRVT